MRKNCYKNENFKITMIKWKIVETYRGVFNLEFKWFVFLVNSKTILGKLKFYYKLC